MGDYIFPDSVQFDIIEELYIDLINKKNKVLALDTGIGKTLVAECIIKKYVLNEKKAVCVICSPNVFNNVWIEHLNQHRFRTFSYHGSGRTDIYYTKESQSIPDMSRFDVVFTSYDIFATESDNILFDSHIGLIIIDEIQKVLNSKKETLFLKKIAMITGIKKLALTATPLQNSVIDILTLGCILQGSPDRGTLKDYNYDYLHIEKNIKKGVVSDFDRLMYARIIDCAKKICDNMILFLNKKDYEKKNTDVRFVERYDYAIFLPLSENEIEGYNCLSGTNSIKNKQMALTYYLSYPLLNKFSNYYNQNNATLKNVTKYKAVTALVRNVNPVDKIIIFSCYKKVVEYYKNGLHSEGISAISITGDNSSAERSLILKKFKNDTTVKVLLMTLSSSAEGLNIESANHVVFIDMWFNPVKHKQACDRIHRRTQTQPCYVYFLIADKCESEIFLLRTLQKKATDYNIIFETALFDLQRFTISLHKNIESEICQIVNKLQKIKHIPTNEVEEPNKDNSRKTIFDTLTELDLMKQNPILYSSDVKHHPDDDIAYDFDDESGGNDESLFSGDSSLDLYDFSDS